VQVLSQPNALQQAHSADALCVGRIAIPDHNGHEGIFQAGKFVQQMVKLKDKADLVAPQTRPRLLTQGGNINAIDEDRATRRDVKHTEQMQQSRFATTRLAYNRDKLAGPNLQVNAVQHRHGHLANVCLL
jgi:hypothetical protein